MFVWRKEILPELCCRMSVHLTRQGIRQCPQCRGQTFFTKVQSISKNALSSSRSTLVDGNIGEKHSSCVNNRVVHEEFRALGITMANACRCRCTPTYLGLAKHVGPIQDERGGALYREALQDACNSAILRLRCFLENKLLLICR